MGRGQGLFEGVRRCVTGYVKRGVKVCVRKCVIRCVKGYIRTCVKVRWVLVNPGKGRVGREGGEKK